MQLIYGRQPNSISGYLSNFSTAVSGAKGFHRLLLTALPSIPRHAYHPFLYELHSALRRLRNRPNRVRKVFSDRRNLLVNLGCCSYGKPHSRCGAVLNGGNLKLRNTTNRCHPRWATSASRPIDLATLHPSAGCNGGYIELSRGKSLLFPRADPSLLSQTAF